MNRFKNTIHNLIEMLLRQRGVKSRRILLALSAVVVFMTTYLLIMPGFTLEKETAMEQGGIDLTASEQIAGDPAASGAEDADPSDDASGSENAQSEIKEEASGEEEPASASEEPVTGPEEETSGADEPVSAAEEADSDADEPASDADEGSLVYEGRDFSIEITDKKNVLPDSTRIEAREISPEDDKQAAEYEQLYKDALDALGSDISFAKFYDISLVDGENEIEPDKAVDVTITYKKALQKELKVVDSGDVSIIHFAVDKNTGETTAEILDDSKVDVTVVDEKLAETSFEAESFSAYGVISRESATGDTDLDGNSYVLVSNNNRMLIGEPHPTEEGRLVAINANPTVGGILNINGRATMWTFEAVPDSPGWYYVSDGNGNYINLTNGADDGGTLTLGDRQPIYVATRQSGGDILYQLRNNEVHTASRAVNLYNNRTEDGFGAWKPSVNNNANNDWFRLYDMEYLGDIRVTFNANGGDAAAPADMWGLAGDTIILPDYSGTREGYEFLGWYTRASLQNKTFYTAYPPGSEYIVPESNTTLYAVWNSTTPDIGEFYIRLDGRIPHEPGNYDSSAYTGKIEITGAVKQHTWIIDSDATKPNNGLYVENDVTAGLNQVPDVNQIVTNINGSASNLGFRVQNLNGEIVVSEITNQSVNSRNYNVSVGDGLYVMWYVQKRESTWHIDGVLLKKNRVNVAYNGNTPDGSARNLPLGYQVDPETVITIGANGSPTGTVMNPTRPGYIFAGWNTRPDGSGDGYSNQDQYTVHEDITFYAQWSKGTNMLTVTKTNEDDEVLAGAQFKLEEKTSTGSYIEKANRTTGENGTFTYDQMENDTLYRMTETYAPNGYVIQNAFFFKVTVDGPALELHICDENGDLIPESEVPDWLEKEYIPADDPRASGIARIQFKITDERVKRNVRFIKVDEEGEPLAGAQYTLTDSKDREVSGVLKDESGDDGVFSVENALVAYGSYTLTEDKAPVMYAANDPVKFTLNDYVSETENGLTITEDGSGSVVEASCEVSSEVEQGQVTTTYSYTIKVKDVQQPHIIVTKAVIVDGDLDRNDLNTTIYYALTKKGEEGYVTKDNGEIWIESMEIVGGEPQPASVVFDGVDFGEYDVWEMALINDEYTRMYNGLVVSDNFQLDRVSASSDDGGNNANLSAEDIEAQVDFTNNYGEVTQSTSFSANKKWTDRAGNDIDPPEHAVIEFTLYSELRDENGRIVDGSLDSVRSIELDGVHDPDGEDTPWTATFKYLPLRDEEGLEYVYKVKETVTVDGYYPNEYPDDYYVTTSGGTITNRKLLTDVEIHKHFEFYPENEALPGSADGLTFTLNGPDGAETYTLDDFTSQEDDPNDYVMTLHDQPLGSYTLTESGEDDLFAAEEYELVYSVPSAEGESEIGGTQQPVLVLELENSYAQKGSLVVKKESIIHEAVDEQEVPSEISEKEFRFVVMRGSRYLQEDGTLGNTPYEFTLWEGDARAFNNVPAGDYTVIEKDASVAGYIWEVVDGTRRSDGSWSKSLKISDKGSAGEAAFENRYSKIENGDLTVSKDILGGPEEAASKDYEVEITTTLHGEPVWLDADGNLTTEQTVLTVSHSRPLSFTAIHAGTFTVIEHKDDAEFEDYSLDVDYSVTGATDVSGEGSDPDGDTDSEGITFTIHKDGHAEVTITNSYYYLYTPVKITKTVTGNMGSKELYFGFDLYLLDGDGQDAQPIVIDGVTDDAGKIQFSLRHEEERLLEKLPKGAKLKIVEHNVHYTTTVDGRIGVDDGETGQQLDADETHDDHSQDTTETYIFTIPEEGATVDFTNDHTVEQSVILRKIGYDNTDESTWVLPGAGFTVYSDEDLDPDSIVILDDVTELISDENGLLYSGKLGAGTYYLKETSVPSGYNTPEGEYVLTVSEDGVTLDFTGISGQPDLDDWITEETDQTTGEVTYTVTIRNTRGVSLPATGGSGTAIFYILGSILVAVCSIYLITRRRAS